MEALRVLTRLGFATRRAGSQAAKQPTRMPDTPEDALPSPDQRLRTVESGLAVAQEAIASLTHRIAALEGTTTIGRESSLAKGSGGLMNQKQTTQYEIRGVKELNAGIENWRLIRAAARALTAAGKAPFTRIAVYKWIWSRHPRADHDRPTLDPTFQGMIKNAPGGPQSAGGTPLRRVARGLYVLDEEPSGS
jgi:hypothetical protein